MKRIVVLILGIAFISPEISALEVAKIFNDCGVLQRDVEVPVWGWATPGEKLSVTFLEKTYTSKADKKGKWEVTIPPTPYGGPYQIKISGKTEQIVLKDIYVGDVWVCSGQSNMGFMLSQCFDADKEISNSNDPLIRHFRVPQSHADQPSDKLANGSWNVCTPENAASFSAVGYFFAKYLREQFPDVPIGLINNAWGGSKIEPFMSASSFNKTQGEILAQINEIVKKNKAKQLAILDYLDEIPEKDLGMNGEVAIWAQPDLDDSGWDEMDLPVNWEKAGLPSLDGIVWFRKNFNLNSLPRADSTILAIGRIDDDAEIWLNGMRIDNLFNRSYQWSDLRKYKLSNTLFKKGLNQITTKVMDSGGGGGMGGNNDELYVDTRIEKVDISGIWKYKIGEVYLNFLYGPRQKPTTIYNKMVHPINRYKIKGFLWYQGESNTDNITTAQHYEHQFKTLIKQWRNDWGNENLPFYFVQLASFRPEVETPEDHSWAHLRWSQFKALELPGTGMAGAIDIGDANDIHPGNKKDVGRRLSLIALNQTYGISKLKYKNPSYKSYEIRDGKFLVRFENYGEKLIVDNKYGYVNGFSIAGEDGKFKWAKAELANGIVKVWHPEIKNPVLLRYAWHSNALDANLFSSDFLPVIPFKIE